MINNDVNNKWRDVKKEKKLRFRGVGGGGELPTF